MPDKLNRKGLQVKTLPEIREELVTGLRAIYGQDINLDQNTPDGQLLNIFAQSAADMREVIQQVYSSFDPEQATGRTLDQRVALNGVKRKGAAFTFVPVDITIDRDVTLVGLDDKSTELEPDVPNLFTIKDSAGTQFYLLESASLTLPPVVATEAPAEGEEEESEEDARERFEADYNAAEKAYSNAQEDYNHQLLELYTVHGAWSGRDEDGNQNYALPTLPQRPAILSTPLFETDTAGTQVDGADAPAQEEKRTATITMNFRAAEIGAVEVQINTITEAVTLFAGVVAINNPEVASRFTFGRNEETDEQLKLRRRLSVAPSSVGYLEGIQGNLLAIPSVTDAVVYENTLSTVDPVYGIPPHSIWPIVEGGEKEEIAQVLYRTKTAGAGMFGNESFEIPREYGLAFEAKFDRPENIELSIEFTATVIASSGTNRHKLELPDKDKLRREIAENITWEIGERAGGDEVIEFLKQRNPLLRISKMELSADSDKLKEQSDGKVSLLPKKLYYRFKTSFDRITINDR